MEIRSGEPAGGARPRRILLWQAVRMLLLALILSLSLAVTANAVDVEVSKTNPSFLFNGINYEEYVGLSAENSYRTDLGSANLNGATFTLTAKGYNVMFVAKLASTTTLKITNKNTRASMKITYTTGGNTSPNANTATTVEIPAGGNISFSVTSEKGDSAAALSGTITISNIEFGPASVWAKFPAVENGTYTVVYDKGGDNISIPVPSTDETLRSSTKSYTLTASPNAGYELFGWWGQKAGWLTDNDMSTPNEIVYSAADDDTIKPVFRKIGAGLYYIPEDRNTFYQYLDLAITAAQTQSSKTVVVCGGGNILDSTGKTEFTIPSGVSLVIPYEASKITPNASSDNHPYALTEYVNTATIATSIALYNENVSFELTLPAKNSLTVNGKLFVGGGIHSNFRVAGATYKDIKHANLKLESGSQIIVSGSSAILSNCGYIYGDGTVSVNNSATVYEPMVFMDFYGGTYTLGAGGQGATISHGALISINNNPPGNTPVTDETAVFPFMRWTMMNIQSNFVINGTGKLKAYVDLYSFSDHNRVTISIIDGTSGVLSVNSNTVVSCTYDSGACVTTLNGSKDIPMGKVGRTRVRVEGGASMGVFSLSLKMVQTQYQITVEIDAAFTTEKMAFNIPYNMELILADGSYVMDKMLNLLPGAGLIVEDGATLTIGSNGKLTVFTSVFDQKRSLGDQDNKDLDMSQSPYAYTNSGLGYPTCQDLATANFSSTADFVVNGTLNVQGNLGGIVQTDGVSGTITTGSAAGLTVKTQLGSVGNADFTVSAGGGLKKLTFYLHQAGATVHTLKAQIYNPVSDTLVDMETGKTYKAIPNTTLSYTSADYTYSVYPKSQDKTHSVLVSLGTNVFLGKDLHLTTRGGWYEYAVTYVRGDNVVTNYIIGTSDSYSGTFVLMPEITISPADGAAAIVSDTLDSVHVTGVNQDITVTISDMVACIVTNGVEREYYTSLQKAVDAYAVSGAYIKMIDNSTEPGFTINKDVYLDLNGKTVTLTSDLTSSDNAFLYGMDSSATDYTSTPEGKLIASGNAVAPVAQSPAAADGTYQRYVAIPNTDGSYSFHRFNISVTGYRFELTAVTELGSLVFQATFEGSETVVNYLNGSAGIGFKLNNVSLSGSMTGEDSSWNTATKQFEAHWRGFVTTENIETTHTAIAWVKFKNGGTQQSDPAKLTYLEALQNASDRADYKEKANAFLKKLGLTEQIS